VVEYRQFLWCRCGPQTLGVLRMKIVSHNVVNGRWVYYGAVFEIKKEIQINLRRGGWTRIGSSRLPDAITKPSAGDRVGNYEILGLAGSGGMGVVYRALDLKLQRTVALKFLPDELVAAKADKDRFLREARTASSLDHPNIGVIHGIEETIDGRSFIVMAYYEGETLARKVSRAPLSLDEAVDIAIQMARGLAEAHARTVMHRDIKPSNVIITPQNVAKIVDFGLARATTTTLSTQTIGTSGTIGYMSPEQTLGKVVDQRTDIWALGLVFAEMVTGRNPFHRDSVPATIVAILNESPKLSDNIPLELQRIIYQALSKEPATRYRTCREMLADLESFRSHLEPSGEAARPQTARSRRTSAGFRETVQRASSQMLLSSATPRQKRLWWLVGVGIIALLLLVLIPSVRNRIAGLFAPSEEHIAVLPTGGAVAPVAYESYLKALGYMQRHDRPENLNLALDALETAVKTDPSFALGYAELGEAYRLKFSHDQNPKWIDEALANCRKALELDDRLPIVYVTLGRIHDSSGKYDLALREFQRALQLDPRNADSLIGLAGSYENAGRVADAEAAFKKAIVLRPDNWDGYNGLGVFYDRHNRYDEAIIQLRHAIDLTPDNARVYLNLAAVYIDSGDTKRFPEAERVLKKSIEISPSYPAYANLGYLYVQEQKFAEAVPIMEKALRLSDNDFLVWGNLMLAYKGLGNEEKAAVARDHELALLEQAAQAKPRDGEIQSYLGVLYAQKKLCDKALPHLQTALLLAPDNSVVLENVGEAYEELGDRVHALQYIQMGLQKGYGLAGLKSNPGLQSLLSDHRFRPHGK
jgi:serine/threonine protein kinase/tetratricopeptide (TPR) repeat protein